MDSWKVNALAAQEDIRAAFNDIDDEVLTHLYDAQTNIALAIQTREEQK